MLAQAQECVWQKAVMGTLERLTTCCYPHILLSGHLKNGLIAKLAAKVSLGTSFEDNKLILGQVASLYRASATSIRQASPPVKHIFPSVSVGCLVRFETTHRGTGLASTP